MEQKYKKVCQNTEGLNIFGDYCNKSLSRSLKVLKGLLCHGAHLKAHLFVISEPSVTDFCNFFHHSKVIQASILASHGL